MINENISDYINVELPSNGECYPCKKGVLRLERMTARDENIITSESLRERGCVCNTLLHNKLLDKDIDVNNLCVGDRNALLVSLRIDGYGNEYVCVSMDEDGNIVEKTVDLSEVKNNIFTMKGDEKGLFNYCDKDNNKYKFKFLTHSDDCSLIECISEDMDIEELYRLYLEKSVVSVNGNDDKGFIMGWFEKMNIITLEKFVKFIRVNTPDITLDYPIGDTFFNDIK